MISVYQEWDYFEIYKEPNMVVDIESIEEVIVLLKACEEFIKNQEEKSNGS